MLREPSNVPKSPSDSLHKIHPGRDRFAVMSCSDCSDASCSNFDTKRNRLRWSGPPFGQHKDRHQSHSCKIRVCKNLDEKNRRPITCSYGLNIDNVPKGHHYQTRNINSEKVLLRKNFSSPTLIFRSILEYYMRAILKHRVLFWP